MDFEAIIRAVIDTASAEAQLNSLLKERQIKIEPVIDSKMYDGMNKQFKVVTSAASAAGSKINKSFSNSIKSGDFHLSDGFIKEQKKILNDNSLMQKKIISAYKTTQSEANKIVNKGRSEQNKQLRKQQIKEVNTYRKANKYSSDYSTGKYDALHTQNKNKLQQYSNKAVSYPSAASAIEKETSAYKELTKAQQEFTSNRSYENAVKLSQAHDNITKSANQAKNAFSMLGSEQAKLISPNRTANFTSSVQGYVQSNPRAYKKLQTEFDSILKSSKSTQMSSKEFSRLESQFSNLKLNSKTAGLEGNSIFGELGRGFKQIGQFALTYGTIQKGVDQFVKSIGNLKDIDSILTEISKTSDMNKSQLKGLGKDSFSHASKYGKLSTDWLLGVQEMNRSGFYGQKGQNMADLSVLAQSAGDLSADVANSYLLATNAAYDYKGSAEKLNAVLDGQNEITNRNSVSMEDMAAATSKAASMGSQMGVTEDQLSALIGTTEARTKSGGDQVGTSLKSLFINLQNINSSKIVETLNKAGASMTEIKNGSQQLRTPIQILGDLQNTFNKLGKSDPLRAEILTNIGGKYHAEICMYVQKCA